MRRFLLLCCVGILTSAPAFAESGGLAEAERAYQSVDFPATHAAAKKAIEAGGADREQTARLYVLLGISAAAQGDAEEAKTDFVVALAVKPSLKLDKGLSPKVRDPYLEAQGYWAAASADRLTLSAKPASDRDHLVIQLSDPATLVSRVELHIAEAGKTPRPSFELAAAPATRFALPAQVRGRSYEYTLRALDRFGNVLAERGSDADPELVRAEAVHANQSGTPTAAAQRGRSYALPIALGVAGLGAVTAGVVFQVKRENAAQDWNGSSCEQPGQTRIQQCQDVDDRRQKYEHLAIGFYAAGGALLTGSVIALIAGRPAPSPKLRAGLLGCGLAGTAVSCDGRF
ncbi:MAG TPA: hypothetical protein VER11_22390 [Polyangiaceae bacterium]|nr:hypothetical protein [Polyangiaceae bacterium]